VATQLAQRRAQGVSGRVALVRGDAEEVFRREYPQLVAIARRVLGSSAQAEDAAQEAFVGFLSSSVPPDRVRGWLASAAAHTALNQIRSDRRRERRELLAVPRDDAAPDTADVVAGEADRARVRAALAGLPRTQAVVLVLRHSGLSYQEIATAVGLSASSVGTTLRRAEARMRKELTDDDPRH
jgi:RNA polymerase sigma factor (sigma-70 family)